LFVSLALAWLNRTGLGRVLIARPPAETRTAAMAALARVGVAERTSQRANTLSGGVQQRRAIARIVVQRAEVVLAVEAVAFLDLPVPGLAAL